MKRLSLALLLLALAAWPTHAQQPAQVIGPVTPGDCPQFSSTTIIKDGGFNCNGGPGGTLQPGQVLGNNGTSAGPAAPVSVWGGVATPGNATLYASPTGNDTNNNCLSSGSPCTLKGACLERARIATFLTNATTINIADGTYSSTDGNGALCTIFGNSGGSSSSLTFLVGNCTTPANVILQIPSNSIGVFTKDLGETEIECLHLTGAPASNGNIGVSGAQFSVVDIINVTFDGTWGANSVHYQFSQSASLNVDQGETIGSNFNIHFRLSGNANLSATSTTTCTVTPTFTTLLSTADAYVNLSSWSSSGCGGSTGTKAVMQNGFGVFGGVPCNTLLFGNGNCQLTLGFQDDAGDNQTSSQPVGGVSCTVTTPAHLTVVNGVVTVCN